MIDDDTLKHYLADALPAADMARIEKALRDSAELRERLELVREDRTDPLLHSLGAFWRRSRLTCATREQLGSYLLEVLDADQSGYIKFHLEVVECPFCRANLIDLKAKTRPAVVADRERHRRIFHSSRGLLPGGKG
jgi:hypothetical protein